MTPYLDGNGWACDRILAHSCQKTATTRQLLEPVRRDTWNLVAQGDFAVMLEMSRLGYPTKLLHKALRELPALKNDVAVH